VPSRNRSIAQRFPEQLGSGWFVVFEAIVQSLQDSKLALLEEGLATLAFAVDAADAAAGHAALLPRLAALAVLAATQDGHPHLCFDALRCLQRMAGALVRHGVGMAVRIRLKQLLCWPLRTLAHMS
jgi:hypothetical protein